MTGGDSLIAAFHGQTLGRVERGDRPERVRLLIDSDYRPGALRLSESFLSGAGREIRPDLASAFLGGYAPEGNQRRALAARYGLDPRDLFALLSRFGASLAGALTFRLDGESSTFSPRYDSLSSADLGRLLRRAVDDHDLALRDDSRSMIQGFQPKVLLARFADGGPWMQPHGRAHSTHIVKPQLATRPAAIHDEFYSHELTRHMGLSHFRSELGTAGRTRFLAIERFDRHVVDEQVELVHQEDAAQALGLDWVDDEAKFQDPMNPMSPRHPSAERIATLAAGLDPDAVELWIRQLTYRVLVGDNDGHAKNVGILHTPGSDTLTDLYDALPNLYQEGRIDWNMALAVDGQFDHRRMSVERIVAEAASWHVLGRTSVEDIVSTTIDRFRSALDEVRAPRGISDGLRPALEWNVERLREGLEISEPKR